MEPSFVPALQNDVIAAVDDWCAMQSTGGTRGPEIYQFWKTLYMDYIVEVCMGSLLELGTF